MLRGAGPPNRASIACCWASPGDRPAVPATGGVRLKSGGMISGALRATANSSGVACAAQHGAAARRNGGDQQQGGENFTHVR